MSERIIFSNHSFISEKEACVPVNDRGFLFGDGVFTTLKVCEGKVECYSLHEQRLKRQCEVLGIVFPQIEFKWIQELIVRNKAMDNTWRLKIIITGGEGAALDLLPRSHGQFIMTLKPYQERMEPFRLIVYPYPVASPLASIKSLAYLDRLWIKKYAQTHGFDDALSVEESGFVLETAFSNIFWRLGDQIFSPHPKLPFLSGISLQIVEKAAKESGLLFEPVNAKVDDIPKEAQLFVCNSLMGIHPVSVLNEREFTRNLSFEKSFRQHYQRLVDACKP